MYTPYGKKAWRGKFGEFGESVIRQSKPSKLVFTINNLLADLIIHQI